MKTLFTTIFACLALVTCTFAQPKFEWASKIGGKFAGYMTVDNAGNVYTSGEIKTDTPNYKEDYNPGQDTSYLVNDGTAWGFINKFDSHGNFKWVKKTGGSFDFNSGGRNREISVDNSGNIYLAGIFSGTDDFDPGQQEFNLTAIGYDPDIFILKLDSSGNFIWAKRIGGRMNDRFYSLCLDKAGNIYIGGNFQSTVDFDPGPDTVTLVSDAYNTNFILKLDTDGNFIWVKQFHTTNALRSMAVDAMGNVCVTGLIYSGTVDFDPGPGTFNLSDTCGTLFILKLNSDGNFLWAKRFGVIQSGSDVGSGGSLIKIDEQGNIFSSGSFKGTGDFDPGDNSHILYDTMYSYYLLKLDKDGKFQWVHTSPFVSAFSVDPYGSVYCTGTFGQGSFDSGTGIHTVTAKGTDDSFISKYDPSGNLVFVEQIGSNSTRNYQDERLEHYDFEITGEHGYSISVTRTGDIYTCGTFIDTVDFDPSLSSEYKLSGYGFFLFKLSQSNFSDVLESPEVANFLSIYPNPSSSSITVSFGKQITNGRIKLINLLGQTTFEQADVNGGSFSLDITNQLKGMYFIEMSEGGNVQRVKVVKE